MTAEKSVELLLYSSPLLFPTRRRVLAHLFADPHSGFRWDRGTLVLARKELGTLEEFARHCRAQEDSEYELPSYRMCMRLEQDIEAAQDAGLHVTEESYGLPRWRAKLWPTSNLLHIPDDVAEDWLDLAVEAVAKLRDRILPPATEAELAWERLCETRIGQASRAQQEAWLTEVAIRLDRLRLS